MNSLPFERIKRTILVRKDADTSPKFGKDPSKRAVQELLDYGIVNLNKPEGPTSHQVSDYAKRVLHISKAGHSGTLDPNVTGILPVALGKATKIAQALLTAGKEYVCVMHLHKDVPEAEIRKVCASFVGRIRQMPPLKSAVKREWRYRNIYYLEVLEIDGRDVLFKAGTQAGTYIRKLCSDIGEVLGGAHMQELRRTKAGPFNESTNMVSLQDLADAYWFWKNENDEKLIRDCIQPMEIGAKHLPKVWVLDTTVDPLCHGVNLNAPGIAKVESDIQLDETVAVFTLKGELVATGIAKMLSKDMVKSEKGFAVKIDRVFMEPNVYPRMQKS